LRPFTLTPNAVYGASKSGIVAGRALRVELDRYGVGVVVCPGRWRRRSSIRDVHQAEGAAQTTMTVPPAVVEAVPDAIRRNREIVTVPRYWAGCPRPTSLGCARITRYRDGVDDLYQR
jgi:short-subunit dehydrogenase